ncbi:murein biosynthesis integral membrane protein MurJ, partial [Roseibium sp.]
MSLVRNFATVGSATLLSRVLGFVRDVLLAAALGAGPVADAFVVAFRLPNLFRRLFAEGAFNSAFIPLFGRTVEEEGDEGARRFAGEIGSALLFCLLVLTAVAQILMPFVVWALAPGFADDAQKFDLTVMMSRIAFPYLIFMSLLAYVGGILNTYQRFAAAAFAPVMLNVV